MIAPSRRASAFQARQCASGEKGKGVRAFVNPPPKRPKQRQESAPKIANHPRMTLDAETSAAYYEALQLPPGSSPQQIHAQYRHLAKLYHPDRNPHRREWSEGQLRRLNEAYHALAESSALLPPPAAAAPPIPPPQHAPVRPEPAPRPRLGRRILRYGAVVGVVCAASIAYANWPQSLPMPTAPQTSAALSPSPPAALPNLPADGEQAVLTEKFSTENVGIDDLVTRASLLVAQVNAEMQHAPQSRRPQKAEQLAADALELSRLQRSVRAGLEDLRTPTSQDLHRTQVADLQVALFQLGRQQRLVDAETASFPVK